MTSSSLSNSHDNNCYQFPADSSDYYVGTILCSRVAATWRVGQIDPDSCVLIAGLPPLKNKPLSANQRAEILELGR